MACERYRETLAGVAAGAPASAGLETHLAACDACRDELAALRQALALADADLADRLSAEPPPELAARILQAVTEARPSPAWRFGWLWPATAAAATLLVALAVWPVRGPVIPRDWRAQQTEAQPRARSMDGVRGGSAGLVIPSVDSVSPGPEGSTRFAGSTSPGTNRAAGDERAVAVARRRPPALKRTVAEPEVLVPPGEAEALLRFATLVRDRAVAPESLLVADLSTPLPEPSSLEIAPLEIVPLNPAETSGTD